MSTKNLKKIVSALLIFAVLAGIGVALTPPPPPPPPVNQTIGLNDTTIDLLRTTATDQSACRACHQTSGTNISGGYNNTVGGVPTRHHGMVQRGVINPFTNAPFACQDCHPSTPGVGNGILLDRSCVNCHNGTAFYANSIGGRVGNIPGPHHVNTAYASSNVGNPAANRTCNFCHGSFVANFNDGHYKPSYATDFFITPFASFKATNTSQPDGLGGNKVWGGCESCHKGSVPGTANIDGVNVRSNVDSHHKEIRDSATPGMQCSWCHISTFFTPIIDGGTGLAISSAMELRNSTIEATSPLEPGTTNITVQGTGCEKCHDVRSLHNINSQVPFVQNGPQGKGHIQNNLDCYGCHNSWLPTDTNPWGAIIPTMDSVSPSVIAAGTVTTLTITGSNFVNDAFTSVVTVDGVTYIPASITDSQITVDIPALPAGTHKLQLVKGGDTLSKLSTLLVAPNPKITTAKLSKGVLTITGLNFGSKPPTNSQYYVSVDHAGNKIKSTTITSWSNTQIKAKNSGAATGDWVTVMTTDAGEVQAQIT